MGLAATGLLRIGGLIAVAGLLGAVPTAAQRLDFATYSVEDGLPQSQVYALLQDRRGRLWIGTAGGGASRFDGREFTNYGIAQGLPSNVVFAFAEDHDGHLWLGTEEGLCRFDGRGFSCLRAADGLPDDAVRAVAEDRQGRLWLGTEGGLASFDGREFTRYTTTDGLSPDSVRALALDRHGNLWLGTEGGIRRFDGEGLRNVATAELGTGSTVYSILEDRDGVLWFGTDDGVVVYDGRAFRRAAAALRGESVRALHQDSRGHLWLGTNEGGVVKMDGGGSTRLTESQGLPSNTVWAILEDREGQIWLGTYRGGLSRYAGDRFLHYTTRDGLGDDVVRALAEDRRGNLWIGTFRSGVDRFDGTAFRHFGRADGLRDDFVLALLADHDDRLWIGTYRGLSRYDGAGFTSMTAPPLDGEAIRSLVRDRRGRLWIGTNSRGLVAYEGSSFRTFTKEDGLNSDAVMAVLEDSRGRIWVGTLAGVNRLDGDAFVDVPGDGHLAGKKVFAIAEDEGGGLWFGVYGHGVVKASEDAAAGARFSTFTRADGLSNESVVSLVFDDDGGLWIGTERGVDRLDAELFEKTGEKAFVAYGREEGFAGIECVQNAALRSSAGHLWFGTTQGLVRYDSAAWAPRHLEPLTHVESVKIFFEERNLSEHAAGLDAASGLPAGLVLPYDMNHVTFQFTGVRLVAPRQVRYRYMLEGFDSKWSPASAKNEATYANLPPGAYRFLVRAGSGAGPWNEVPAAFSFRIANPFWRTWWFRSLATLAVAFLVYGTLWLRLRAVEKRREGLERQVAQRTAEVRRQKDALQRKNAELEEFVYVVSHDLKSPLFTIRGFLGALKKDLADDNEKQIREDLEHMDAAAGSMARLLDELLAVSRAGRMIAEREDVPAAEVARDAASLLAGRIREAGAEIEIAADLPVISCDRSRLLQVFQNLIENAVKFMGEQPSPRIRVAWRRRQGETVLFVEDNGIGIDAADQERVFGLFDRLEKKVEGAGVGLALVKKIVEVHGGRVWIESAGQGQGTRVCFTLAAPPAEGG